MSRSYRLFWSSKYFTPFLKVILTLGPAVNHQPEYYNRTADFYNMVKWHFVGKWYFAYQISPVSFFEYVAIDNYMYERNQVIKRKKQRKHIFFSSALFLRMGKPRTLVSLITIFLLLSKHSQVLTFFGSGFAFLHAITYGFYFLI